MHQRRPTSGRPDCCAESVYQPPWGKGNAFVSTVEEDGSVCLEFRSGSGIGDLKRQLANPPVLAAPIEKEPLLLYVAANARAVSVAIVVERKEAGKEYPVQRPVYYISEVVIESKQRYPHWQKLVYGVFMASRKLKQYF